MGYQGGRRYGGSYERGYQGGDWDRGQDRYRGGGDQGYRYGTRGQFGGQSDYRREPPGYEAEDRGFLDRAGDEVRSWFGDEEAERRREYDDYMNRHYGDPRDAGERYFAGGGRSSPERHYAPHGGSSAHYGYYGQGADRNRSGTADPHYSNWRQQRIDELDRDYAEYQRENRQRFDNEFGVWRNRRGEQRQAVQQVKEHMEVVGSDGSHVGKVDKLRGDRIILTKSDSDAGGVHHSIPSSWIKTVDAQKVTLEKTADQAQHAWRTEREQQALFGGRYEQDRSSESSWSRDYAADRSRWR